MAPARRGHCTSGRHVLPVSTKYSPASQWSQREQHGMRPKRLAPSLTRDAPGHQMGNIGYPPYSDSWVPQKGQKAIPM